MWQYNYSDELIHFGVPGMKWGHRKNPTHYGGSITKTGKYKASNGVVIAKSRNAGVAVGRRLSTTTTGKALSSVGSIGLNKKQKDRMKKERAALKEYYKVGGDKMLSRASDSKQHNTKAAYKQEKINNKKSAVKDYNKKLNAAEKASNIADKKWNEVDEKYKALGKNRVSRMLNSMKGTSDAAKAYSKAYDEAYSMSVRADAKWKDAKSAYKNTGVNRFSRVVNNIKYDPNRKKR